MSPLSCVIVEDDPISLMMVVGLAEKTGFLSVENTFDAPDKAMLWLSKNNVDLLFLDIEMPVMTGLDMLRTLPFKPEVIIVSSNKNYAVDAFDLSVIDYLIKPVNDYSRFLSAVNKVIARKTPSKHDSDEENFFLKVDSLLLKVDVDSIFYVEAFGDYIKIHTPEKIHTVYSTLKKIEDKLNPRKFVRVHRSFIVNLSKITNIEPSNVEINKRIIPVSATYKEAFLGRINII